MEAFDSSIFSITQTKEAGIFTLTFDLPEERVNKLNQAVLDESSQLIAYLNRLSQETSVKALIFQSGKKGNFLAGADIRLIQTADSKDAARGLSEQGQKFLNEWEDLPFITVAAIDGAAMGGGCEWALACDAIVCSTADHTKIGLPEVLLGILPGLGGSSRMVRKVGLAQSLDLILSGRALAGQKAYKAGLSDGLVQKEAFEENVLNWTKRNLDALCKGERVGKKPKLGGVGGVLGAAFEKTNAGRKLMLSQAKKSVLKKTKGHYPAPLEILDLLSKNGARYGKRLRARPRDRAMKLEAEAFAKLAVSPESKHLIRLFFLTEEVKKAKGVTGADLSAIVQVKNAAVIGAGVMGGGVAQLFADKGFLVRMKDVSKEALETGVRSAHQIFRSKVKRKRLSQREGQVRLNRIQPTLNDQGFDGVQYVVEAIVENMEIKKKVLSELEASVSQDCVIVTNTSSLSVSEMQNALKNPERFAGMHFFNPVHRMPLVEVIRGEKTSNETIAQVFEVTKRLGKTPVVVKDGAGFLVNRILMPYMNEAIYLVGDGAPIDQIDSTMTRFGMPMGPMELLDEVGLDVAAKVSQVLFESFGDRMVPSKLPRKLIEKKYLGKKNLSRLLELRKEKNRLQA